MNPDHFMTLVYWEKGGPTMTELILIALTFAVGYILGKLKKEK